MSIVCYTKVKCVIGSTYQLVVKMKSAIVIEANVDIS